MRRSRKFHWGWGYPENCFCSQQRISQRSVRTSVEKQLDPRAPIASRGWSVPELLRRPIATCDCPRVGGCPDPLSPISIRPWFCFEELADELHCLLWRDLTSYSYNDGVPRPQRTGHIKRTWHTKFYTPTEASIKESWLCPVCILHPTLWRDILA